MLSGRRVLGWWRTRNGVRVVLIADIAGSTALYERLGDSEARRLVARRLEALTRCAERHGGHVVKTMGDAVLCLFTAPEEALHAAVAMSRACDDDDVTARLPVRIAVHRGGVLHEQDDIFGDTVNTVSRVSGLAKPGEILLTRAVLDALPRGLRQRARSVHSVVLKGTRETLDLYTLSCGVEANAELTLQPVLARSGSTRLRFDRLELRLGQQTLTMEGRHPALTLGRDATCTLCADGPEISRVHARIEHRRGKFVLVDQSANGTWVLPDGRHAVQLHREEALLVGEGVICLGSEPEAAGAHAIRYRTLVTQGDVVQGEAIQQEGGRAT
jgi:class 3 adenylate cyclase